jgi:hypothetical protein
MTFHFCNKLIKDFEHSQSLEVEQLFLTVDQNNFQSKQNTYPIIPLLSDPETFTRLSEYQLQLLR